MQSLSKIRRIAFAAALLFPAAAWGQTLGTQWLPAVQQEWEKSGKQYFQPVPAEQPHASLRLRDSALREGVGAFEIWVLVDGALVRGGLGAGALRLAPGPHCIRIEMVSIAQRYEGTLGKYWPWLRAGGEDELAFSGNRTGFRATYQPLKLTVGRDLVDNNQLEFNRNRPQNPDAAYAYCMEQVRKRRAQ
jgi:hypothetical protein